LDTGTIVVVQVRVHSVFKQQKHKSSIDPTAERDRTEWYGISRYVLTSIDEFLVVSRQLIFSL